MDNNRARTARFAFRQARCDGRSGCGRRRCSGDLERERFRLDADDRRRGAAANLAPAIANAVLKDHVRQLARTGASVLVVEQRARAVLEISDRTYVLTGGQLRMEGTPSELAASSEFIESFLGGGAAASKGSHS